MTDSKDSAPRNCPGCGIPFQQDKPESPGFVPASVAIDEQTICRRCFRLIHYRQATKAPLSDDIILGVLRQEMGEADGAILFVDAFQPAIAPLVRHLLREWGKPILTVINKYDMLSRWFRSGGGTRRLADILGIGTGSFLTMNALDHSSVKRVVSSLSPRFPQGSRILLIGPVNSGKTTFMKSACPEAHRASRSPMPGTTLGPVKVSCARLGMTLIDIPGFRSQDPWIPVLCPDCLVDLQPGKKPARLTTSLKAGDLLLFGGLAGVEILECLKLDRVGIATFTPEKLAPHRTSAEKESDLLERHAGGLLPVPCPGCRQTLRDLPWSKTEFRLHKEQDLVLPGCGWMTIWQGEARVAVHAPEFFRPFTRRALIGGDDVHEC